MKFINIFENLEIEDRYNEDGKLLPSSIYKIYGDADISYEVVLDPRLIVKYTVEDDSDTTLIYGGMDYEGISVLNYFTKIEVDGVEISLTDLDENNGYYQLSEGEHTIKYTLADPTEIEYAAFESCRGLTSVTIPNSVITIGDEAFDGCRSLTNVVIPNSVTTISDSAFRDCYSLTSVTIPNSVTTISETAFESCRGLTSVTIGNSVTSIGDYVFSNCSGLTNITIPNSVTYIGEMAFHNCSSLTSVTVQATTPPTLEYSNVFNNTNNCPIYVPSASVNTYKAATNWSSLSSRIQAIP